MTTDTWKVNSDGNWSTAADWSRGVIPQAGDSVVISTTKLHTITYDRASPSVSVASLKVGDDNFDVSNGFGTVTRIRFDRTGLKTSAEASKDGRTSSSWKGVTGDWSVGADWTGGVPNSSGANAIINAAGSYTVTIASTEAFTVDTLKVNDVNAALAIAGGLTVKSDLANTAGTVRLAGTSTLRVGGAFANSGTLDLDTNEDGGGSLKIGGTLANTGTVQIGSSNGSLTAATPVTLGGLTNASGAVFRMYGSASHAAMLSFSGGAGSFTSNSGYFELVDCAPLTLNNAFTNNGTGTVYLDGTSALTVTGTFANNGALDLNTVSSGGSLTIGGVLTNDGTVQVGNGSLTAATKVTLGGLTNASGANFSMRGSASHAATLAFSGGAGSFTSNSGVFALSDTTPLTLNNAFTNSGSFTLDGTSALTVTGAFANSGTLDLDTNEDGGGSLKIGGTLANTGTVQIGSSNGSLTAATPVTLGGLTNASGAVFRMYGSASHAAMLSFSGGAGSFTSNSGYFELVDCAPLTLNNAFTNNGTGTVYLDGTSALTVTGTFANNGALDLNTVSSGGSLTIGGVLTNDGTVQVGNGSLTAATKVTLGGLTNASGANFSMRGSASHAATLAFSGGAGSFTSNSGVFALSDTTPLTLNNAFTNSGSFTLDGTSALTVTGAFANSGTLDLDTNEDGGGSLKIGGTLANTGTVQIGSSNGSLTAATPVTLGGLTNASGAVFRMYGSASHAAMLSFSGGAGSFTSNSGYFELVDCAPLTLNNAFTNNGTGTVYLDGTSALTVTGTFANNGALDLNTVSSGGSLTIGGVLTNDGTVQVGNGSLTAATKVTLGGLTNASGANFSMRGSASHAATLAFSGGAGSFTSNSGVFALSDTTPLTLNNAFTNSGSFTLDGTSALTVTGAFANSGTLDLDTNEDGGGSLKIGGTLANTGTVQIGSSNGSLTAATPVTLGGLTNASGAVFRMYGSASHAAMLSFSGGAGSFTSNSGYFELVDCAPLTLNNAFTNNGTGTVYLDGTSALTVTGTFANNGALDLNTVSSGGSLTIGGVLTNDGTVQVGNGSLTAATKVTLGGLTNASGANFSMRGSASHAATLAFSGGAGSFTSNSGVFALSDTTPLTLNNAFTNSGSFTLDGTSSLTVTGAFANSGTLDLDTNEDGGGSLKIGGTLANTGTVQIGSSNGSLTAATPVTLGGLTNASGAVFRMYGSASHAAMLSFSGGAGSFTSNSGYFELVDCAPLTLNNAFTNNGTGTVYLDGTSALTVTGTFANNGALDLNTVSSGGSLTIGGVLTNDGTVQVGNGSLTAATKVTLGGLTNASGAVFRMYGSANHPATVTVNGAANNAGTLTVGAGSVFDVAGGHVFTQTAGTTTVIGLFTAKTIDVDGGNFVVDTTNFTNIGTLKAADGGYINLSAGGLTNLSAGTLTGGTYEVDAGSTLRLANNAPIVTDDADIILKGAGSATEDYNTSTLSYDTVDATLRTIGATGQLHLLARRSLTTAAAAISDNGLIQLGGGTLKVTGKGSSLTIGAAGELEGFGVVDARTLTNSGLIEASGGTLTVRNAIKGTGRLQIGAKATLVLGGTAATTEAVTFKGKGATLTLDHVGNLTGTIGGFGVDDTLDLVGVTANAAKVNGSNQLVITENGKVVDTLQLSGNNSGFDFITKAVAGGTDIISLPVPATVADYLDVPTDYDLIAGGFAISDTAANISAALNSLNDTKINAIIISDNDVIGLTVDEFANDAKAIGKLANANAKPYQLAVTDSLPNIVGDLSALNGNSHVTSLDATSGAATLSGGATIAAPAFTLTGSSTALTLAEILTYSGSFSADAGATVSISSGDSLTLSGKDVFSGATISGSGALDANGTTTVSGLTIGGATTFSDGGKLTESAGSTTLGDSSGKVSSLTIASTGTWDILDNSGIARGKSTASAITNSGLFEKTGGTGPSTIAPVVTNTGTIKVSSGTLDLMSAVAGTGTDTISGASTLEFGAGVSTAAKLGSQNIGFSAGGGTLDLLAPTGFYGEISRFGSSDTVDLLGSWAFSGISQAGDMTTLTLHHGSTAHGFEFVGHYTRSEFHITPGSTTIIKFA